MGRIRPIAFSRAALLFLSLLVFAPEAPAQCASAPQPRPPPDSSDHAKDPEQPIEHSVEYISKLTLGIYFTPGDQVYDLNLRHQFGALTAWIAGYYDPQATKLLRV